MVTKYSIKRRSAHATAVTMQRQTVTDENAIKTINAYGLYGPPMLFTFQNSTDS